MIIKQRENIQNLKVERESSNQKWTTNFLQICHTAAGNVEQEEYDSSKMLGLFIALLNLSKLSADDFFKICDNFNRLFGARDKFHKSNI